jgi:hypothetical protein
MVTDFRTGFLHSPELILAPELETPAAAAPAARNLVSEAMPLQAPEAERAYLEATSGLYYKSFTIIIDDARVVSK